MLLLQVYMPLFTLTVAQAEWRHEMFKTAESIDTGTSVRVVCKKKKTKDEIMMWWACGVCVWRWINHYGPVLVTGLPLPAAWEGWREAERWTSNPVFRNHFSCSWQPITAVWLCAPDGQRSRAAAGPRQSLNPLQRWSAFGLFSFPLALAGSE